MLRSLSMAVVMVLAASMAVAQQEAGRAIFEGKGMCWACHARDATGGPLAPNLTDGEWLNVDSVTVTAVRELIRQGVPKPKKHPAPMPPMGGATLSAEELEAVAAYVLSLARRPPDGGTTH